MSPRKKAPVSFNITINQHSIYFAIQKAFQDNGIHLVDLETGKIIKGQVNITDIGMIRHEKHKPKTRRALGFLSFIEPDPDESVDLVEATITILQNPEKVPVPILICVIDNNQVADWVNIIASIAGLFVEVSHGKGTQLVTFEIETLCVPDPEDPKSALDTMLYRIHKQYSGSADVVSNQDIPLSDLGFDDEE